MQCDCEKELARLRKRVNQRERSLAVLADAVSALRNGSLALRDENHRLRVELERLRAGSSRDRPRRLVA